MEYIKDMSAEKQNEIRAEVTEAYRWVLNDKETAVQIICGRSVDSAIQSHFID